MSYPPIAAYETSGGILTSLGIKPVLYANGTRSTVGTTTLVAAESGKKIRVLGFYATAAAAVNIQFKSASSDLGANLAVSGVASAYCPHGWFETADGEALGFAIDGATATSVQVVYVVVD